VGKYVRDEKDFDQYRFFLCAMANELAEANRLKRIKLTKLQYQLEANKKDILNPFVISNKDLEDQA